MSELKVLYVKMDAGFYVELVRRAEDVGISLSDLVRLVLRHNYDKPIKIDGEKVAK